MLQKNPKRYRAITTFMVSDKKEEIRYSDYASLDYGISERASIKYNLDKIIQLSTSRRVVTDALLKKGYDPRHCRLFGKSS